MGAPSQREVEGLLVQVETNGVLVQDKGALGFTQFRSSEHAGTLAICSGSDLLVACRSCLKYSLRASSFGFKHGLLASGFCLEVLLSNRCLSGAEGNGPYSVLLCRELLLLGPVLLLRDLTHVLVRKLDRDHVGAVDDLAVQVLEAIVAIEALRVEGLDCPDEGRVIAFGLHPDQTLVAFLAHEVSDDRGNRGGDRLNPVAWLARCSVQRLVRIDRPQVHENLESEAEVVFVLHLNNQECVLRPPKQRRHNFIPRKNLGLFGFSVPLQGVPLEVVRLDRLPQANPFHTEVQIPKATRCFLVVWKLYQLVADHDVPPDRDHEVVKHATTGATSFAGVTSCVTTVFVGSAGDTSHNGNDLSLSGKDEELLLLPRSDLADRPAQRQVHGGVEEGNDDDHHSQQRVGVPPEHRYAAAQEVQVDPKHPVDFLLHETRYLSLVAMMPKNDSTPSRNHYGHSCEPKKYYTQKNRKVKLWARGDSNSHGLLH